MALPSNTFLFNYNAKEYDAVTHTFPKTQGQLFDENLVLNNAISKPADDYVVFDTNSYMGYTFANSSSNPFNVTSSNKNFTFIYKTSGFTSDDTNIFANRRNDFNLMIRGNRAIFGTEYCKYTVNYDPQIVVIRVDSNGVCSRNVVDINGVVLQTSSTTITFRNNVDGVGFFAGFAQGGEYFRKTFYWMYCSRETLTDAEVQQVINFNENVVNFSIDPESISLPYTGGSSAITISSELDWSASTESDWISISPSAGTSAVTSTTVSILENSNYSARTGTVTFTDGDNTAELTVSQDKKPKTVFLRNFYRGDNDIKMMIKNGSIIYHEFFKLL